MRAIRSSVVTRRGREDSPAEPRELRPRSLRLLDGLVLGSAGYGNSPRWRPGERLEQLFERQCDTLAATGCADHLAVSADSVELTYHALDALANQLARYLVSSGIEPGDRLGLLFNEPVDSYVAIFAALKSGASYVPLDSGYPVDRLSCIVADANVKAVLSRAGPSALTESLVGQTGIINVDQVRQQVAAQSQKRLSPGPVASAGDDLCYVIYTSGTTGRPKAWRLRTRASATSSGRRPRSTA